MGKKLPHFQELWENYPVGGSDAVKADIGGGVDGDWVTNTCTIRGSRAFNYSGDGQHKIPRTMDLGGGKKLATTYGADGLRYAFRVAEFDPYMRKVYGPPAVSAERPSGGFVDAEAFRGKLGLMVFDCRGVWDDATGHVDIWSGKSMTCRGSAYFNKARAVYLWTAPIYYQLRLAEVDPGDAKSQDDRFRLFSDDGSYEQIKTVADDVGSEEKVLELLFTDLDPSKRYSLEVDPGAEGEKYMLFENTSYFD